VHATRVRRAGNLAWDKQWLRQKYSWAGHVARLLEDRLARKRFCVSAALFAEQRAMLGTRSGGRPKLGRCKNRWDEWLSQYFREWRGDTRWDQIAADKIRYDNHRRLFAPWVVNKHKNIMNRQLLAKGSREQRFY